MQVYNKQIESNVVMNTTITSAAMQLKNMYGYSIQVVFTGTPTGTFKLQASSDPLYSGPPGANPAEPTNWTDVTNSPYAVTAAGNYMWNVFDTMYNYVRLVYSDTSGGTSTAVLTSAIFNGKGW